MVLFYLISRYFHVSVIALNLAYCLGVSIISAQADEIKFNTDILDIEDRSNIDLGQFSRGAYIMPGDYIMLVHINKQELAEQTVTFYAVDGDATRSEACISPAIVKQLGLKTNTQKNIAWAREGQCLILSSLPGILIREDLGSSTLSISLPQTYLEYAAEDWDPPSRWDDGITGLLFDYNVNAQAQRQQEQKTQGYNVSSNGVLGTNLGAWRVRADWQSRIDGQNTSGASSPKSWDWSRYYAYRAVPNLGAKLLLGESFLNSDVFDSFRFSGASLVTDDNMLPPNLRGYAPEVAGIARTNARVTISQQGRILYETQVASGPFRIQDIHDAVSGQLNVRVEELDGSVQEFTVDTASIPYLTRPGTVRYKISAGKPSNWQHQTQGSPFATGEFSWGVSNGWSLYGGGVAGGDYNALALGVGRDLMVLGALSFDATQSRARLSQYDDVLSGKSYRLSYSKRFDEYNSQVTFAGYRFSERDFMSMGEYLDIHASGTRMHNSKEMYTLTFNKQFVDLGLSAYLNYNHQTYWDRPNNDNYNLTLSRYFDMGRFKDVSTSVTVYRNKYDSTRDDGMYLSLSIPFGGTGSVSYSSTLNRNDMTHQVSYSDRVNNNDTYQVSSGMSRRGMSASGYYSHQGDRAQINTNASYQEGAYSSAGLSLQGGATATLEGAALHRTSIMGGTRILVDTDGVKNVPVRGYGATTQTNHFGKAVVGDVSSYYRNQVSIDLNMLPDNVEATRSVVQATLTEGAIGYRRFDVLSGEKAMAVIRLADGATPPFGASVLNRKTKEVGIVSEGGNVYLSGINAGEEMTVHWDGQVQCMVSLPAILSNSNQTDLLLPCHLISRETASVVAAR